MDKDSLFNKWEEMRRKYIIEMKSISDLANEYDGQVSRTRIGEVAKNESWVNQRDEYWIEVGQEFDKKSKIQIIDAKLKLYEVGMTMLNKALTILKETNIEEQLRVNPRLLVAFAKTGSEIISQFISKDEVNNNKVNENGLLDNLSLLLNKAVENKKNGFAINQLTEEQKIIMSEGLEHN